MSRTLEFRELALPVAFTYSNGAAGGLGSILETLGGGVALFDFDRDGQLDACFAGGGDILPDRTIRGRAPLLLRNLGHATFVPVTQAGDILSPAQFTHGCTAGDFDNDGFTDLLLTGYGGLRLLRNQGDGTFVDVTQSSQLLESEWSTGAAWADFDRDGDLDLYVAHYVNWSFDGHRSCPGPDSNSPEICGPKHYDAVSDRLYRNLGDGRFEDATAEYRLVSGGKGLGVIAADIDLDGDIDVYVGNDTTDNFLYLNDGAGRFEEAGLDRGVAVDESGRATGSMGVDLCDFDQDGLPDLWAANYELETFALYRNLGNGRFLHSSRRTGVTAIGDLYVGWGTAFADFDADGDFDVITATGHVMKYPVAAPVRQTSVVLLNEAQRFRLATFSPADYLGRPHAARGLAIGDLDGDGDLDLAISHNDEPVALLVNDSGDAREWLQVRLVGRESCRDAIGCQLVLHTQPGKPATQIKGGGSYLSTSELSSRWPIDPDNAPTELEIRWPSGRLQRVEIAPHDRRLTIVEPRAETTEPREP
ncbi:MAG TPA: CRTAC1 family protein [Planctomycetaceae bacterium]|nr:CRTAC1 family protein [Planctomycetaceae bacterium]